VVNFKVEREKYVELAVSLIF